MRIEMKREAELAKRRGLANRTAVAVVTLILGFVIAYLLSALLFSKEIITVDFFYNELAIPETVNQAMLQIGFAFVIVIILQLIVVMAFGLTNPAARARPGTPTVEAKDLDYYDAHYNFQAASNPVEMNQQEYQPGQD